jgi:hypothetical protein
VVSGAPREACQLKTVFSVKLRRGRGGRPIINCEFCQVMTLHVCIEGFFPPFGGGTPLTQKWRGDGISLPRVGVNVSASQFQQKDFMDILDKIVRDCGMQASSLEVEITESLLLEATSTVETMLTKLKSIGVPRVT